MPTPKAFGDWLRAFDAEGLMRLEQFLLDHAQYSRKKIDGEAALTIDMDSTTHIQHAEKMEGLDFDYKGNWGLRAAYRAQMKWDFLMQ